MFGILKPCFCGNRDLSLKKTWMANYCDLCGSLSNLFGVSKRTMALYDVATLNWLLQGNACNDPRYPSYNCLRGGTLPHPKASPTSLRRFLASFSVIACSVKLFDDQKDSPNIKTKLLGRFAEPAFEKAITIANEEGLDSSFVEAQLNLQNEIELSRTDDLLAASGPTAHCYSKVASIVASKSLAMDPEEAGILGGYLGRCVYLLDALKDKDRDLKSGNYNPFLCGKTTTGNAQHRLALKEVLNNLRPYVEGVFANLPKEFQGKWHSIMKGLFAGSELPKRDRLYLCCVCPCCGGQVMADEGDLKGCGKCCCWITCGCCALAVLSNNN